MFSVFILGSVYPSKYNLFSVAANFSDCSLDLGAFWSTPKDPYADFNYFLDCSILIVEEDHKKVGQDCV